jgi:hypothetical protein
MALVPSRPRKTTAGRSLARVNSPTIPRVVVWARGAPAIAMSFEVIPACPLLDKTTSSPILHTILALLQDLAGWIIPHTAECG